MTFVVDTEGVAQDYDAWCDTEFGPQLDAQAWSAGDPAPHVAPYRERHTWATVARRAALAVGTAAAIAGAVLVLGGSKAATPAPEPSSPPTATALPTGTDTIVPPEPPEPTTLPPVPDAMHITNDGEYVQLILRGNHWAYLDMGVPEAVQYGHEVCHARAYGYSPTEIAMGSRGAEHNSLAEGLVIINAAITVYCPEYR